MAAMRASPSVPAEEAPKDDGATFVLPRSADGHTGSAAPAPTHARGSASFKVSLILLMGVAEREIFLGEADLLEASSQLTLRAGPWSLLPSILATAEPTRPEAGALAAAAAEAEATGEAETADEAEATDENVAAAR